MSTRVKIQLGRKRSRLPGAIGLAYAAGLFDGEGCVHIAKQRKRTARNGHIFRLSVTVAQNHLDTLVDFQELAGVEGRIYQRPRQGSANRDSYALNYDGEAAAELLEALQPFLKRKRDEARIGLKFQRECEISRHFGPKGCPEHIWKRRDALYKKLKKLK